LTVGGRRRSEAPLLRPTVKNDSHGSVSSGTRSYPSDPKKHLGRKVGSSSYYYLLVHELRVNKMLMLVGGGPAALHPQPSTYYLLVALGPVHTWVRKEREKVGSFAPPTFFFPSHHPSITCPNYRLIFSNRVGWWGRAGGPPPTNPLLNN
jgi:hypothetical protein